MGNKYCDHGLYGNAVVVGSTSGSSTTLTVASVSSGRLGLGAMISGTGIAANTYISALGTGAGGAGTYTMSAAMTIAGGTTITATYGGPALIPEWNVAQEGDGTASTAATPATAAIVFSGIPSTGTIQVLGVTLSPTWATSASVCADNLATAINAATGTATGPAALTVKSQVRNHIYARGPSNGAAANTCEIMTRQGSADFNGQVCIAHTLNNVSTASPINFASGAGGAWGNLGNLLTTSWPSAIAAAGYGVWTSNGSFVGIQNAGDIVYIRAGNKTCLCAGNSFTIPSTIGSLTAPVVYTIEDGTTVAAWNGDGSTPVLHFYYLPSGTSNFGINNLGRAIVKGKKYSNGTRNLKLSDLASGGGNSVFLAPGNSGQFYSIELTATGATGGAAVAQLQLSGSATTEHTKVVDCLFAHNQNSFFINTQGTSQYICDVMDCEFSNGSIAGSNSYGLIVSGSNAQEITFTDCRFTNFQTGSKLINSMSTEEKLIFRNCNFGNVSSRTGMVANTAFTGAFDFYKTVVASNNFPKYDFFVETPRGIVEWNSTLNYPTLNALLPDTFAGSKSWSLRVSPSTITNQTNFGSPLVTPRLNKINSLADGARTVTIQFCSSMSGTPTKATVSLVVEYEATDGSIVTLDSYDPFASSLSTTGDSVAWSSEDGSSPRKVQFSDSGYIYFDKYNIALTTPTGKNMKSGTNVGFWFRVHTSVTTVGQYLFVDPDVAIA